MLLLQSAVKVSKKSRSKTMPSNDISRAVRVTLVKSTIGCIASHRACVRGLGLRRINQSVTLTSSPEIRGMINAISYLLRVEELS